MTQAHWAAAHIGTPWVPGVSDCWSFARTVWRDRWDWTVPPLTVDPQDARAVRHALGIPPEDAGWLATDRPVEGDAVLMAKGARPCHVGIWIVPPSGVGVLHSVERSGVVFTPPPRLAGIGYRIIGTYRRVE